jgi:hypothetical protein
MVGRIWTKGADGKKGLQEDEMVERGMNVTRNVMVGRDWEGKRNEKEGRGIDGRRKEMVERDMDAKRKQGWQKGGGGIGRRENFVVKRRYCGKRYRKGMNEETV